MWFISLRTGNFARPNLDRFVLASWFLCFCVFLDFVLCLFFCGLFVVCSWFVCVWFVHVWFVRGFCSCIVPFLISRMTSASIFLTLQSSIFACDVCDVCDTCDVCDVWDSCDVCDVWDSCDTCDVWDSCGIRVIRVIRVMCGIRVIRVIRVMCVICQGSYRAVSDLAHDVRFDLPDVTVFDLHMTELTGLAVRPHIDEVRGEIHRTSQ